MRTFLKTHWLTITICLVVSLIASGAAFYFVHAAGQENKASSLKMAEDLKTAMASLANANLSLTKIKVERDKEKAINADLKKAMAASEKEIESLRSSLETSTQALLKAPKPKADKPLVGAEKPQARPASTPQKCRESDSGTGKEQLSALQNLQADIYRQENELREKQKKLDADLNKLAAERQKLMLDKSEYRWPHNADPGSK